MQSTIILALFAATPASAFFWDYELYSMPRYHYYTTSSREIETAPSPYGWTASADSYDLKLRLPDLEPHTVSAALASDGTKIEVAGERKIEGCTCQPRTVKEIALPYRPRAEDVGVTIKDGVLSLSLARHAKEDVPTPVKVHLDTAVEKSEPEAKPLRFVPHASATEGAPSSLEEKEKGALDKFRSAALAAVAVNKDKEPTPAETPAAEPADAANASTGEAPAEA